MRPELRQGLHPIVSYDLDCSDIPDRSLRVVGRDIHGFDGDVITCEKWGSRRPQGHASVRLVLRLWRSLRDLLTLWT